MRLVLLAAMLIALVVAFVGGHFFGGAALDALGLGSPDAENIAANNAPDTGVSVPAPQPEPPAPTPVESGSVLATPPGVMIDLATLRPVGMLGASYNQGELPASQLRAQAGVVAVMPGSLSVGHKCDVQSYDVALISVRSRERTQIHNADARFGNDAQGLLQKAGPGDVVIITSIQTLCADGSARPATPVVISVR